MAGVSGSFGQTLPFSQCLNHQQGKVVVIDEGSSSANAGSVEAGSDGQGILTLASDTEIRFKENTLLRRQGPGLWQITKGLAGFRIGEGAATSFEIRTPHGLIQCPKGLLVVKMYPSMSRVAVLKGKAVVAGEDRRALELLSGFERGLATQEVSDPYKALEDLYYAWYWDPPKAVASATKEKDPVN